MKWLYLLLGILLSQLVFAQGNPMFRRSAPEVKDSVVVRSVERVEPSSGVLSDFRELSVQYQAHLRDELSQSVAEFNNGNRTVLFSIFFFSLVYGLLHALGPGHGKVAIGAYCAGEQKRIIDGVLLSFLVAGLHSISGVVTALVLIFGIGQLSISYYSGSDAEQIIQVISYVILLFVGVFLLAQSFFKHNDDIKTTSKYGFVVGVGLVPCPGSIISMCFFASMGVVGAGLLSALGIFLGIAIALATIGVIAISSVSFVERYTKYDQRKSLGRVLEIVSASVIILFASFLLWTLL